MKILLLEDNEILSKGLSDALTKANFLVDVFHDGEDGMFALKTMAYDLLLLDLGLPSKDGIDIIKELRKSKVHIPILVLSARDRLDQRILGLDLGADDYICKPFEIDEVISRVYALLRRSNNQMTNTIVYNDLEFDTQALVLSKNNSIIDLSKRELEIFAYLLRNINKVISKENIADYITSIDDVLNPVAVETYISRLRKKLGTSVNLKTVRGLGYMLN